MNSPFVAPIYLSFPLRGYGGGLYCQNARPLPPSGLPRRVVSGGFGHVCVRALRSLVLLRFLFAPSRSWFSPCAWGYSAWWVPASAFGGFRVLPASFSVGAFALWWGFVRPPWSVAPVGCLGLVRFAGPSGLVFFMRVSRIVAH
jgi:hypothetical protein